MKTRNFLFLILILFFACNDSSDIKNSAGKRDTLDSWKEKTDYSNIIRFANFRMVAPANWFREEPDNSLRIIQFRVQGAEELKITGYYLGAQKKGDSLKLRRWFNEFASVSDSSSRRIDNGLIMLKIEGVYKKKPSSMAQEYEEVPGFTSLVAIAPSIKGFYYFKLVGPSDKVTEEEANFKSFMKSYTSY
jgi:hypothetical protein